MSPCISPEQFQRLLAEQLNDHERASLEAHVEACPECEQKLAGLLEAGAGSVDWRRLRWTRSEISPRSEESLVQRLREPQTNQAALAEAGLPGRLGRYRITARIGSGAFGVVYKGHDEELRRDVAIKPWHSLSTLRPDGRPRGRKTRFRLLARLCRVGLIAHKVPAKGFHFASYIASSFPKLPGATN
jgi:hypothetical protein